MAYVLVGTMRDECGDYFREPLAVAETEDALWKWKEQHLAENTNALDECVFLSIEEVPFVG